MFNNPTVFTDPGGHDPVCSVVVDDQCVQSTNANHKANIKPRKELPDNLKAVTLLKSDDNPDIPTVEEGLSKLHDDITAERAKPTLELEDGIEAAIVGTVTTFVALAICSANTPVCVAEGIIVGVSGDLAYTAIGRQLEADIRKYEEVMYLFQDALLHSEAKGLTIMMYSGSFSYYSLSVVGSNTSVLLNYHQAQYINELFGGYLLP